MVFLSPHSVIVAQQILDRRHTAFLLLEETDDEQQYRRANRGHDDRAEHAAGDYVEQAENISADYRADDADNNIVHEAEATTLDEFAREPPGDCTD
jgi:hypothetical protein